MSITLTWPPRHLGLPKADTLPEECEDAYACGIAHLKGREVHVVAIADGATESAFAGRWAHQLTTHAVHDPAWLLAPSGTPLTPQWLASPRQEYASGIAMSALPWYARAAAARGSFATLVCLVIDLERGRYHALAAGDSCLVIVRHERTAHARVQLLPDTLWDLAAFRRRPHLLGSTPAFDGSLPGLQHEVHGSLELGTTTFLLMTDALAAWFVAACLAGGRPWRTLAALGDQRRFEAFVARARGRRRHALHNDDVTLVRLCAVVTRETRPS